MESLNKELKKYNERSLYPLHMPGHKKRLATCSDLPYNLDFTEVEGTDDLHNPGGIIKQAQERAAKLWKSENCLFLVGGSTCGILSGIRALTQPGDRVLIARNCHKSVWHGCELCHLKTDYICPDTDKDNGILLHVSPEKIEKQLLENPDTKLIVITSPTYDGVVSDIGKIVGIAHSKGVKVLVDEAHGAHLDLSENFTGSGVKAGADIVVQSLHKTLPALTQCALAHVNNECIGDFRRQLNIFETSSPSYILLQSIDSCVGYLAENGEKDFVNLDRALESFYKKTENLKNLVVFKGENAFYHDRSRIVVLTQNCNITGVVLAEMLRDIYGFETEMADRDKVIAITTTGDDKIMLSKFADALTEIDSHLENTDKKAVFSCFENEKRIEICDAVFKEKKQIPLNESAGAVSGDYVWAYPPGIPIIVPGEVITKTVIDYISELKKNNVNVIMPGGDLIGIID